MKTNTKASLAGIVLALTLLSVGCSLKEEIFDTPVPNQVLTKESDVPVVLYGLYGAMADIFAEGGIYLPLTNGTEIVGLGSVDAERTYKYDASSNYVKSLYSRNYKVINNANSLLENLEKISFQNTANADRYRGEVSFLRAFSYFHLVRFFGKVPIVTKSTTSSGDYNAPRSSVDDVYKLVFDGFKLASATCPKANGMSTAERGRVTKGAAQALLAEAYLTYANYLDLAKRTSESSAYYQLAKNYADSVILSGSYQLVPKYADLFDNTKENDAYKEVIFGIQYTADASAGSLGSNGASFATFFAPANRFKVCGVAPDGLASATYGITPWVYDLYTQGNYKGTDGTLDFRMGNTMIPTRYVNDVASRTAGKSVEMTTYPQIRNSATDVNPSRFFANTTKYIDSRGLTLSNNGNDYFYIRLAEIYLIKAEAMNELGGPVAEAIDAFNQVRARARTSAIFVSAVPKNLAISEVNSKEDFRLKIYDERVVELYGEGRNFFDVRRMRYKDNSRTILQYIIQDVYPRLMAEGNNKSLEFNTTTNQWEGVRLNVLQVPAGWNEKWLLFPIPATEYLLNPGFKGDYNPGWN
ncbi:RagB/SusD family nutrient uptake outer membrane protein [Runella sp. MFBS21]|uniref:RagB/SusD family nutrient uptake outer membrane protein n=1 Tax=Runella sp. MFBS21 TaxID=3034018 RepID=UPI0023F83426|nr:RagB/SusD family nutrient uptake outer membrane protein [Runella sp. MFBS21]MDF7822050.1 RagB/SusD family nutrient uptake outer membrane protein [Runella sp. MFBS21]